MKALDRSMMSQVNGGVVAGAAIFSEVVVGIFVLGSTYYDPDPSGAWWARAMCFGMGIILLTDAYQRMRDNGPNKKTVV